MTDILIPTGSVAQWITRLTTNQEIAGSTPARVELFFDTGYIKYLWTFISELSNQITKTIVDQFVEIAREKSN